MVLFGREDLLAQVADAVDQARAGRSGTVILEGDAGSGKSALVGAAIAAMPSDVTVLSASGHPAESETGYAGLHQLLGPLHGHVDDLDEPHRTHLRCALALGYGPAPSRLAVGHAVLLLLSRVAAAGPVAVFVDDVHWLDRSSLRALVFAARRLDADGVCMVLASRPGEALIAGLGPTLKVPPLDRERSVQLLRARYRQMSGRVADRIARQTGGLPLALTEVPRELTDAQLIGETPIPDPLPAGPGIERLYAKRLSALSAADSQALLLASLGDHPSDILTALLARHDLTVRNLASAERLGLVQVGADGTCRFAHPTVRSAVQARFSSTELSDAHREVASIVAGDPVRYAFHRQQSRPATPTELMAAFASAAEQLARRGSGPEAGRWWEAAAEHSDDVGRAREYWARAIEAYVPANDGRAIRRVAGQLIDTARDAADAARWERLQVAALLWTDGEQPQNITQLIARGQSLLVDSSGDRAFAGLELLYALVFSLLSSGRAAEARHVVEIVRSSPAAALISTPQALLGDAVDVMTGAPGAGSVLRGEWLTELDADDLVDPAIPVGYFGSVLIWLADVEAGSAVVEHLRRSEPSTDLAVVRAFAATVTEALQLTETGQWDRAGLEFASAEALAADADHHGALNLLALWHAVIPAARGDAAECERLRSRVQARHTISRDHLDGWVRGLLRLSRGDHEGACRVFAEVDALERSSGLVLSGYTSWFADWVEARWHLGTAHELAPRIAELADVADRVGHTTMAARAARCQALLDDDFDSTFARATELHDRSANGYERARTELLWGRRLRRDRRRGAARTHLESALAGFESVAADSWIAATRVELAACGVRVVDGPSVPSALSGLTPREFQVVREVAAGASNATAASRLFVSPRTVEYHLSNAYRKLDVTERAALADLFAAGKSDHLS